MACLKIKKTNSVIVHTDRGSQYRSNIYREIIEKKMKGSYSRKGNTYDNTIGDDNIGALMLGVTTEYDFYQTNDLAIYISGSFGVAASESETKEFFSNRKETLKSNLYAKLGLGARFNNGIGLEAGSRAISYKYDLSGTTNDYSDKMYRQQFYLEANYTF